MLSNPARMIKRAKQSSLFSFRSIHVTLNVDKYEGIAEDQRNLHRLLHGSPPINDLNCKIAEIHLVYQG